ncbi:MAG: ABC transporter permease [Actinobacteria bacterium]|nr:ABC transporter permease [Actinomycetota bacterium]
MSEAAVPLAPLRARWRVLTPAFVRRDWKIARSYRLQFLLDVAVVPLALALFYFLSELVEPSRLPADADLSKGYFSYAAVGLVVLRMVQTALSSFATKLRTEQVSGTFETLLASPVAPSAVVLGSATFELLRALTGGGVTLLVASLFGLRLELGVGSIIGLVVGLPALVVTFAAVGVVVASFAVVVKQVTALIGLVTAALGLLAGAYFPIELLPDPLRTVANLLPFTWGVDVLRAALLRGELATGRLAALVGFAVVSLPLSLWFFRLCVDRARRGGTLTQF